MPCFLAASGVQGLAACAQCAQQLKWFCIDVDVVAVGTFLIQSYHIVERNHISDVSFK